MDKFQELELFINYLPRGQEKDNENAPNNNLNKKKKRNKNKSNKQFNQEGNNEKTNLSEIQRKIREKIESFNTNKGKR